MPTPHHPSAAVRKALAKLEELLAHYGKNDLVWFDGIRPRDAEHMQSAELLTTSQRL
jgi:hypothetical protein